MYFKSSAEISVVHQKLHTWFKVIPSLESKFNTQKHCFATIKNIEQSNNKLLNQNLTPLKSVVHQKLHTWLGIRYLPKI